MDVDRDYEIYKEKIWSHILHLNLEDTLLMFGIQ